MTWIRGICRPLLVGLVLLAGCSGRAPLDEAKEAGKTAAHFPQSDYDYFEGMDGGIELTREEIMGRNTWVMWTGGNYAFWDYLAGHSFGNLDFLKILSSYPGDPEKYPYSRDNRFTYFGLMNEPGFEKPTEPGEHGLWLDNRTATGPLPDAEVYGRPSGIMGLRLFDNPEFEEHRGAWDAEKYYNDPGYYLNPELVRPYRVGMACGFCHIAPNPNNPPPDPNNPKYEHMSNTIGSQYFWIGRSFFAHPDPSNYIWQMLNASPPGSLDTSFIATDNIFNPRTINSIYEVEARLSQVESERLGPNNLAVPGTPDEVGDIDTPHILKEGADSVGVLGALARVYLNIGEYHQEWIRNINPLAGGQRQTPFKVTTAIENSTFWLASEDRVGNLAAFLTKASKPHRLADAPGGADYLGHDPPEVVQRGKIVFAAQCAQCHSSKQPPGDLRPDLPAYQEWMRAEVQKDDFLEGNYLSDDKRYRVTDIGTNACATLANNGARGRIWDNFTSETYKNLPAVGQIELWHDEAWTNLSEQDKRFQMPAGGRGYLRTPTLVGLWASAPFLHNNSLGLFNNKTSVDGRMAAFNDAVEKLLWPEKRLSPDLSPAELNEKSYCHQNWKLPFCGPIYRTTDTSYLVFHKFFLPRILHGQVDENDELRLGPIPKGTPVGLIANINAEISFSAQPLQLVKVVLKLKGILKQIEDDGMNEDEARELFRTVLPDLWGVNKCPDFVVNKGHTFGAELSDSDKRALISFLKRM